MTNKNSACLAAGFSLIEVMTAIVIVSVIAIVSMRSFVSMKKSEVSLRGADACKSYLDSAFKNIDLYGVMPTMVDSATVPNIKNKGAASAFTNIKNAPSANVFPLMNSVLVNYADSSIGLSQLNTPVLLGGTIAMLNGLYNQNATVCAATIHYSGINQVIPNMPAGLLSTAPFTLDMTLEPYDILTGVVASGCTAQTSRTLAPKGIATTGTAAQQVNPALGSSFAIATMNASIDNSTGFQVTLNSQFTTADGRQHSCSAARKYSYVADFTAVAAPSGSITVGPTTMTPTYGPDWVQLNLAYSGKPGSVLFCQDISQYADPNDNVGNLAYGNYGDPMYPAGTALGNRYTPCERTTLCGKSMIRSGVYYADTHFARPVPGDPTQFTMAAKWTNEGVANSSNRVPAYGCIPKVEVVAVDMAGNTSPGTIIQAPLLGALQDCHGSWGACTQPYAGACGAGNGTQTYTIAWPAQYGGSTATCAAANGATQSCNLPLCPAVNCVGNWGGCIPTGSPSCGAGSGQETYTITTPASGGGAACPATNGQTLSCSIGSCLPAVNCVGSWGTCTGVCGTGSQSYTVTTPASGGGIACPAANGATQSCALPACPVPVNCVGSWGACSASCGGGTQIYTVTTPASGGGSLCPAVSGATQSCNTTACPSSCAAMCSLPSPTKPISYAASTLGFTCDSTNSFPSAVSNCAGTYVGVSGFKGTCDNSLYSCSDFAANPVPNCPSGWYYDSVAGVCSGPVTSPTCAANSPSLFSSQCPIQSTNTSSSTSYENVTSCIDCGSGKISIQCSYGDSSLDSMGNVTLSHDYVRWFSYGSGIYSDSGVVWSSSYNGSVTVSGNPNAGSCP